MNRIHVMHVLPNLEVGGMENGVVNLANGMNDEEFKVSICCLSTLGPLAARLSRDVPVFNLDQKPGKAPGLAWRLLKLYRQERVHIVHTHNDYAGIYGVVAARLGSIPVVVHGEHGLSDFVNGHRRLIKKFVCFLSDRITAVSAGLQDDVKRVWGVPAKKITILLNGVNQSIFSRANVSPSADQNPLRREREEIVLGTVGRLCAQKNYPLLLRSMAQALKKVPRLRLVFVGDGPLRQELESMARELSIENRVDFLGERKGIPELLGMMDIFVLPSCMGEGIANSMLEAMSMGLPVIASDIKGNIEVVVDGETGFLFPSNDRTALADKIVQLGLDPHLRQRFGSAGIRRIERVFSLERMIADYEAFYAGLMQQRRADHSVWNRWNLLFQWAKKD